MLELIRNKLRRKNKASETLEKYWELKYKDLLSRHEALRGRKTNRCEKKNILECGYESLKREIQDLRSVLDEKSEENLSLRDNLASLNSLIATKEAEKEIISAQLKDAESLREACDALAVTMLEEALLREEEIKAKFENAIRLKDVSIAVLKERHASETQRLTAEKEKAVSELAEALREAEGCK
jgi:chromosome segregation ATPase